MSRKQEGFMRQVRSLAGLWQFQLDPQGSLEISKFKAEREIQVPLPWQVAFPDLQQYSGYAWYRREFELNEADLAGELLLHFGAVDYWCQVFVNGEMVGEHEGGYTPFSFPIRSQVHAGKNELAVRVYDSVQSEMTIPRWPEYPPISSPAGPPFDANHIPHGKQEWYINVGGLWQDVTLTAVPATYLNHISVTPDIHSGDARIKVELAGRTSDLSAGRLRLNIKGKGPHTWDTVVTLNPGQTAYEAVIKVEQPQLWQVESPYLYTLNAELQLGDIKDSLTTRFGFREITTRNGQLLLNGEPLFLLSALDQDLYADTIYTVPSEEYLRDQFRKAKELGLNNLRCHIKPPDPLYLDLADEMGLLVWAEIPSWRTFYPKGTVHANQLNLDDTIKQRVAQTLEEMIRRDFNHPSIIIWTIVNEDWGTALPLSAADRAWVGEMYEYCKKLDPTRLVVDNSACPHAWGPNVHVRSDLDDFHIYSNVPDQANKFEQTIEQFDLRPLWTYSSTGDAVRNGQEPLILSEFGNWGLPSVQTLRQHYQGDPDWFKIGPWWSPWDGEPGWASGVEERFCQYGLDKIWPDYEAFANATQQHQFAAMKFQIDAMRRQPALAGYVITELADIYWESNGLLDFLRNPKTYHALFHHINSPDMIIPQVSHYAYWDDQPLRVALHASHYSRANWQGAKLRWSSTHDSRQSEELAQTLKPGEVKKLGLHHYKLPEAQKSQMVNYTWSLEDASGHELARNWLDLLVLPGAERKARYQGQVAVIARPMVGETSSGSADSALPFVEGDALSTGEGSTLPTERDLTGQDVSASTSSGSGFARRLARLGYNVSTNLSAETNLVVTNFPNQEVMKWVREGGDMLFISSGPSPFYWVQGRGGTYGGNWMTSFSWLRPGILRRLEGITNPLELPFKRVMPQGAILGLPVSDASVQQDFLAGQIAGWINHPAIHTVQFRYGRGRVIMTTFALRSALTEYHDPLAIAMLHDLIDYLTSDSCQPQLTANF
jgi:hypothetical protein